MTVRISDLGPAELISTVLEIERLLGRDREREVRWGPRTVDLDVLVWGERTIHTPSLEIPHPRLAARRFVLAPLRDLLGDDAEIPGLGRIDGLLRAVAEQEVEELSASW